MFVSIYSWNYSSTTLRDMKFLKITNYGKGILWPQILLSVDANYDVCVCAKVLSKLLCGLLIP